MRRSRATLATIEAAPMAGTSASPPTTQRVGRSKPGGWLPSTRIARGGTGRGGGGPAHRQQRGAQDVEPVDLLDRRGPHGDDGALGQCGRQRLAPGGREELGVR